MYFVSDGVFCLLYNAHYVYILKKSNKKYKSVLNEYEFTKAILHKVQNGNEMKSSKLTLIS